VKAQFALLANLPTHPVSVPIALPTARRTGAAPNDRLLSLYNAHSSRRRGVAPRAEGHPGRVRRTPALQMPSTDALVCRTLGLGSESYAGWVSARAMWMEPLCDRSRRSGGCVASLRERGTSFRNEILTGPSGRQILCEDPSGNPTELFQPT
jgi:hypothetical protein